VTNEPPELTVESHGNGGRDDDASDLASVVLIDRREDIAGICGRVDTAPTFAVVVHAPDGNRQLATELGIRRLQRHVEDAGKVMAIATPNVALAGRARQNGIPVARRPEHVRWDSGGRRVVRLAGRSFATPRLGRYVQAAIILAIALVFVVLTVTMAPSATVTAYPPTETLSKTVTITASADRNDIDFQNLAVPARTVSATQRMTLGIKTTGQVSVGVQQAKVTVAISNPGKAEVTVPDRAALVGGPDGLAFELDKATNVLPGQTVTQSATAQNPGVAGNLPANSITGWRDDTLKALIVTNPDPAAGGTNEDRPAVDARDILAITQMAQDLTKSETARQTLATSRPHDAVFLKTAQMSVEFTAPAAPAGTPADLLLLDVDLTVTATAVLEGTLDALARQVLMVDQGIGEFIPGTVSAVETGARQIDAQAKTISTEVILKGEFARNVTPDTIRDTVLGKDEADAKSTLAERYGIQDADVSVSPGWMPWLPRFGFRVSVELRSRAADGANVSKGSSTNVPTPTPVAPAASATARP
jgi:hypothetical protein